MAIIIPIAFLGSISVGSIFTYRPWCGLFCPFGMISNLSSRFSWYNLKRNDDCTDCGLCEQICPTENAERDSNKGECYYCGRCVDICPQNALELKN
jgi:polyferredoxin